MNARLVITTQYRENYGAHDWDGKGECPQYWKSKGGSEYLVAELTLSEIQALGEAGIDALVEEARPVVEQNDEYATSYVIDHNLYFGDEKTPDEEMYEEMKDYMGYNSKPPKMRTVAEVREADEAWQRERKQRETDEAWNEHRAVA